MDISIQTRVKKIIVSCIGVDVNDIHTQTHLVDELYADSLDLLDILIGINEEFGIDCNENDLPNMLTVTEICHIIEKRL